MIDLHAFATPNSIKPVIALEELGLDYALHSVNVRKGEQKAAAFLALNPAGKVPVLVDTSQDGSQPVLSESAAILVYLAEKTGRLLPAAGPARARVFEQLFFHASALSPALGNAGFFKRSSPESQPIAEARFSTEANRLLALLDTRLADQPFVAGDTLSIADIAHWGWLWRREFAGVTFDATPHLARWFDTLATRPAFQRAVARVNVLIPQI